MDYPRRGVLAGKTGIRRFIGPKRIVILALFITIAAWIWTLHSQGILQTDAVFALIQTYPVESISIFLIIYAVCVATMLPTLPFNLLAGVVWGPVLGGVIAATGATVGACISFWVARYLFGQPLAEKFSSRLITWIQNEFDRAGWRFIAFVRLNPIIPTGPLNYMLGLSSIGFTAFSWATLVFLTPPSILVAWMGFEVGSFALEGDVSTLWRTVLGISAVIILMVVVRYATKYFFGRRIKNLESNDSRTDAK